MKDRYLFKAKRVDGNGWIRGFYYFDDEKKEHVIKEKYQYCKIGGFVVIPDTVCQCTGLKDKNGNLIFDGDEIKVDESIGIVRCGLNDIVEFKNISLDQNLNEIANNYDGRYELTGNNVHDEVNNGDK